MEMEVDTVTIIVSLGLAVFASSLALPLSQ